jgi:DNA repair protein RadA/Sms
LVAPTEGPPRRQTTGIDARRFQLVAAVLDRAHVPVGRADLYGASSGGIRVDDPACDLALAAALASAATDAPPPPQSAFVGEISLTGAVRGSGGMVQRLAAATAAGVKTVFAPLGTAPHGAIRIVPVRHVKEALTWAPGRSRGRQDGPPP